jgi:hypothetical protein
MKSSPNSYIFPLLKYIAPETLLTVSLLIWIFSILTIPTTYLYLDPMLEPVLLLVLNIFSFYLGMKVILFKVEEKRALFLVKDHFILYLSLGIGYIGTILRAYQILFQQGYLYAENNTWQRIEMASGELNSGFLGLATALTQPFGFIAFLMVIYFYQKLGWKWLLFVLPLGIYPIVEAYFTQGRLQLVKVILMTTIVVIFFIGHHYKWVIQLVKIKLYEYTLFKFPKKLLSFKILSVIAIASTLTYLFFIGVMEKRLSTFNYTNVIEIWEGYQEMKVDTDFKEKVLKGGNQNIEMAKYSLKHYFAHGPIEYIKMVNHIHRPLGTYYGAYTFHPYVKFFKLFGFETPSNAELSKILKRDSVYTTFWGPIYIDFGWFSILFTFLLGAIIKHTYLRAVQGHYIHILFYSYFGFVVFSSIFVNLLNGSSLYILNALIILWVLKKYL